MLSVHVVDSATMLDKGVSAQRPPWGNTRPNSTLAHSRRAFAIDACARGWRAATQSLRRRR
ncbi:hypothetical protein KXS49_24530, partial [Salmonella enterica subsp. enterica serovar Weltevreden]|nr:hypothetical protein [Salmonella enterica subsp. enterica serovar Weltevreden]